MRELFKVLAFSFGLIALFTLVTYMAPQVVGEAPPEEASAFDAVDEAAFVAIGEALFRGKGACTLCHNSMGRAPDLLTIDLVAVAEGRLRETRYRGEATSAETYLRESLLDPDRYVVKGFGQKGSRDSRSPMPVATRPPASLSADEVEAIIAYLQAKDGHPVTVVLPGDRSASVASVAEPEAANATTPEAGAVLAVRFGCSGCHTLPGSESPIGPSLLDVGLRRDAAALRESILDPEAVTAEGYPAGLMPGDYGERLRVAELQRLVDWLLGLRGERP